MILKSFPLILMIIDRGATAAIFVPLSMMYETEVYLQQILILHGFVSHETP